LNKSVVRLIVNLVVVANFKGWGAAGHFIKSLPVKRDLSTTTKTEHFIHTAAVVFYFQNAKHFESKT